MNNPPSPPDHKRHLRLYLQQWIGIPIILLLPILALCGVFGRAPSAAHASSADLALRVEYASRLRYKENNKLLITVANVSGRTLDNIRVACDSAYAVTYEDPLFIPPADTSHQIAIGSLDPGEQRHVRIEGKIEAMWSNSGYITATADGGTAVSAALHTFVFP